MENLVIILCTVMVCIVIVILLILTGILLPGNSKWALGLLKFEDTNPRPAGHVIDVGNDFSKFPAGRYAADGPNNGTKFREEFLIPALFEHKHVVLDFTEVEFLPVSWLSEVFSNTAVAAMRARVSVYTSDPHHWPYTNLAAKMMEDADQIK